MDVTAIVPAHNEGANIEATIKALKQQVRKVIVACDHCTDDTYQKSIQAGAVAFETVDNQHRKAGALNQALENYVDWQLPDQYIFICDADTVIADDWIERAQIAIDAGGYDAVGSVFFGDADRSSMIEFCQQLEWYRYTNQIKRSKKVFVLTGTASMVSAEMFQKVKARKGSFYDEDSITEDFALTIDLKEAGGQNHFPNLLLLHDGNYAQLATTIFTTATLVFRSAPTNGSPKMGSRFISIRFSTVNVTYFSPSIYGTDCFHRLLNGARLDYF
ncbi:glycosyltransferase family 2 protein [Pediococcus pentosaceus]|uniref:glycosyltransferase family 2 protein n=1 Tax=Pediococcus pentosaceus TaxID=1255 RepID=UPI001E4E0053|nr:glycosyltransferase family 2 protein [Pediococcus pentosaceus]